MKLEDQVFSIDIKYKIILNFLKKIADESVYEKYENLNELNWDAFNLLKDIGEI